MKHLSITIKGKVQGVNFRNEAQKTASMLAVNGWVKNLDNGDVQVEAEGGVDNLRQFVDWLRQGPPQADVKDVQVEDGDPEGYTAFEVKR